MPYVFVRHKVEDYNKWKPVFDEHGAVRKTIGSKCGYLFRNIDNPNEIVMYIEVDDIEKAREFVKSDDLRQTMERSGIADKPDIYFLELVDRPSA